MGKRCCRLSRSRCASRSGADPRGTRTTQCARSKSRSAASFCRAAKLAEAGASMPTSRARPGIALDHPPARSGPWIATSSAIRRPFVWTAGATISHWSTRESGRPASASRTYHPARSTLPSPSGGARRRSRSPRWGNSRRRGFFWRKRPDDERRMAVPDARDAATDAAGEPASQGGPDRPVGALRTAKGPEAAEPGAELRGPGHVAARERVRRPIAKAALAAV